MKYLKVFVFFFISNLWTMPIFPEDPLEGWQKHNNNNQAIIDHQLWDQFLNRYLVIDDPGKVYLVRYGSVSEVDKKLLTSYIHSLINTQITKYNKAEQKAYWINLYNALTLQVILDNYPVESIKDIGIFGPWNKNLVKIEGKELSLNDIEHEILRPIWKDNRIHYAVNCASIGCPNLQNIAYTSQNTEQLLHKAAKQYINHPRGVNFDEEDLVLSSIYKWYSEDFGDDKALLLEHIRLYANKNLKDKLNNWDEDIDYDYDWNLNEAK